MKRIFIILLIVGIMLNSSCIRVNLNQKDAESVEDKSTESEEIRIDSESGKYYRICMRADGILSFDPGVWEAVTTYVDFIDGIMTGFAPREQEAFNELFFWESENAVRLQYFAYKPYYMAQVWKQAYGPIRTYISMPYINDMTVDGDRAKVEADLWWQVDYGDEELLPTGRMTYSIEFIKIEETWLISNIVTNDWLDMEYADQGIDAYHILKVISIPENSTASSEIGISEETRNTSETAGSGDEDAYDKYLEMALKRHEEEQIRVAEFITSQPDNTYSASPENNEDNAEYLIDHLAELQFTNEEDKYLIDKFLYRYNYKGTGGQESDTDVLSSEAQALQYEDALTAEEKETVMRLAEEKIREVLRQEDGDEDAPVLLWISYNEKDYQYFVPRIGQKKPTPWNCIVVCAKKEKHLGEGVYMTFSYMREDDSDEWELINYGY